MSRPTDRILAILRGLRGQGPSSPDADPASEAAEDLDDAEADGEAAAGDDWEIDPKTGKRRKKADAKPADEEDPAWPRARDSVMTTGSN